MKNEQDRVAEHLNKENERLRAALESIAHYVITDNDFPRAVGVLRACAQRALTKD